MQELKSDSESKSESSESNYFDADKLNKLICALLSDDDDIRPAVTSFARFLKYNDVMYFTIRSMYKLIKERKQQRPDGSISSLYSLNVATLLTSIKLPNLKATDAHEQLAKIKTLCSTSGFRFKYDTVAKMFSSTWTTFLSFSVKKTKFNQVFISICLIQKIRQSHIINATHFCFLTIQNCFEAYKRILAVMDSQILPHFKDPLSLADFLINCYNLGGSVALLSLSSLFLLMTKHSL